MTEGELLRYRHCTAPEGDTEIVPPWSIAAPEGTVRSSRPCDRSKILGDRIERRMAATGVVPAFDEVEHGQASIGLGAEAFAIQQLALERREEALAERVVVGITHTAHRRSDPGLAPKARGVYWQP